MGKTKIEWTEYVWNPVTGCSVTSPGCTNCYAMKLAGTRLAHHPSRAGLTQDTKVGQVWTGEVRLNEDWLIQPLKWKRPRRIFVCAHGDLFHENVPDEWIDRVFAVMALAPQHTFQVLTKRSARMRDYMDRACGRIGDQAMALRRTPLCIAKGLGPNGLGPLGHIEPGRQWWPLPNVWLGVSVEDQARADERIPDLLETPAAKRWISAEPLLGPVDLTNITGAEKSREYGSPVHGWSAIWKNNGLGRAWLDWVVVGGESGPGARPMHPDWARSLRDQCQAAGVPFFFKQVGEWFHESELGWWPFGDEAIERCQSVGEYYRVGKKAAGRLLDGREWNEVPA